MVSLFGFLTKRLILGEKTFPRTLATFSLGMTTPVFSDVYYQGMKLVEKLFVVRQAVHEMRLNLMIVGLFPNHFMSKENTARVSVDDKNFLFPGVKQNRVR